MKKTVKMTISLLLIILLILPTMPIYAIASFMVENDNVIADNIITDIEVEEKVICDATINDNFADDSVIVVLKKDANPNFRTLTQEDFPEVQVKAIKSLTEDLEPLVQSVRQINKTEIMTVSASTRAQVFENLVSSTGYEVEELQKIEQGFNQIIRLDLETPGKQNVLKTIKILEKRDDILIAQPNYIYTACSTIPDDPESNEQWSIDTLELEEAWDITTGSSSIMVGIMDSGIDCDHTDLDNNVNIILGRDFTGEDNTMGDTINHGTHVAGIVGAEGYNGKFVTGVCWDIQLINLRVFNARTGNRTSWLIEAIIYATSLGIPILNFSGGSYPNEEALLNAINNYPGLLVCSAGNYGIGDPTVNDEDNYPSSYNSDHIIAVAATNNYDQLWSESYYGATKVDLGAPGEEVLSTTNDGNTDESSGTSMAAPHVTGVAALLMSAYPHLTREQIKRAILSGVDKVSSLEGKCVTGGRLNANNSLRFPQQYYKIAYDANGGTGVMAETRAFYDSDGNSTRDTEREIRANAFTKQGYDFNGWHAYRNYDNKWYYYNAELDEYGWYATQPSNDWEKYRFEDEASIYNLSTVLECDYNYVMNSQENTIDSTVTFYAQWKKYYTVKYEKDYSASDSYMADTKVYYGTTVATTPNGFNNYGNEFDCWFAQRTSDGKWRYQNSDQSQSGWYSEGQQPSGWSKYRHQDECTIHNLSSVAGDVITFYAQWKNHYTVRFMENGGTGSMDNKQYYCGVQARLPLNSYSRDGYKFDCWYAERYSDNKWKYQNADGTQTGWYSEGAQPSGWTKYRYEDRAYINETNVAANELVYLHAQWKNYFIVRYEANDGAGTMADTEVTYGVLTPIRTLGFGRNGYTFDCWHAYRESDGKWRYVNPNNTQQEGWYAEGSQPSGWVKFGYPNACSISHTSDVAGDIVHFYAQWKKHFYVYYDANGGLGSMTATKVVYGEPTQTRENTFTRECYSFEYWYAKRNSDNTWHYQSANGQQTGWYSYGQQPSGWTMRPYYDGEAVSDLVSTPGGAVTFYAQWLQVYRIQYDANGGEGYMPDTVGAFIVDQSNLVQLSECTFTRQGYDFGGWYMYDVNYDLWAYTCDDDYIEWMPEGEEPEGYYKYVFNDQAYVNMPTDEPTTRIMYAHWLEK